jgi:hypothetical protein
MTQEREYLLIVQLLQSEELIEALHFVADTELVIAVLDMSEDHVHELSEHLLWVNVFLHAVSHQSHHDVKSVFVFYFELHLLWLDFEKDHLLPVRLINHPTECNYWGKEDEVDEIIVGLIPKDFANDPDEEDQANQEVFCLHENVYLLKVVWSKEDSIRSLKRLCNEQYDDFNHCIFSL